MSFVQHGILVAAVVGAFSLGDHSIQNPVRATAVEITYEAFIELDYAARAERFRETNAETKAMIMRTHGERWLAENRARLTTGQVDLVREAIAFVTPALYLNPTDPDTLRRTEALEAKLRCRLRHSDIMIAFKVSQPPANASWVDDFSIWFNGCLLGR